jgi:DNA-3-methyladenine glycosylase II
MTTNLHRTHLSNDKILLPLLETVNPYLLQRRSNVCVRLCASIMSQQLSTRVADVIFGRFKAIYSDIEPNAMQIAATPFDTLRSIGLSNAKTNYVLNVANYFVAHKITDEMLYNMSADEVMDFLLPIKGVGKWTVQMLQMFSLGHADVFAPDDLGIQQTMAKLYGLDMTNKKELRQQMLDIAVQWSPYRTYACFYLWCYKDGK